MAINFSIKLKLKNHFPHLDYAGDIISCKLSIRLYYFHPKPKLVYSLLLNRNLRSCAINLPDSFGKNGLHHACSWGQMQTVTYPSSLA
ncbi:hypothetical protein ABK040_014472 [Willaertia magna]